MLAVLLSTTGLSSEEPIPALSPGLMDIWEQRFTVYACFWASGSCCCQFRRREETQSQAGEVNTALSMRLLGKHQVNQELARHRSAAKEAGDNSVQSQRQTQSQLYKQSFRGSSCHTSLKDSALENHHLKITKFMQTKLMRATQVQAEPRNTPCLQVTTVIYEAGNFISPEGGGWCRTPLTPGRYPGSAIPAHNQHQTAPTQAALLLTSCQAHQVRLSPEGTVQL